MIARIVKASASPFRSVCLQGVPVWFSSPFLIPQMGGVCRPVANCLTHPLPPLSTARHLSRDSPIVFFASFLHLSVRLWSIPVHGSVGSPAARSFRGRPRSLPSSSPFSPQGLCPPERDCFLLVSLVFGCSFLFFQKCDFSVPVPTRSPSCEVRDSPLCVFRSLLFPHSSEYNT